ncbi:MAG: hypothetical protein ACE5EE_09110 [Fidelibacterota bacterium]
MEVRRFTVLLLTLILTYLVHVLPAHALTATVSTNAATYSTGERMDLSVGLSNPDSEITVDAYLALMLPDGTFLFLEYDISTGGVTFNPGNVDPSTWTPLVTNITLPSGYSLSSFPLFQYTFSGGELGGNYTCYMALATPGTTDVIGIMGSSVFNFAGVSGLEIPDKLSVVEAAAESASDSPLAIGDAIAEMDAVIPTTAPYYTDKTDVWVYDEAIDPLNMVNEILCAIDQTGYSKMVNKGDYIAMVDMDSCEKGGNKSSTGSTGKSSGADAGKLEFWVVNSSRTDTSSPHIVKIWVKESKDSGSDDFEDMMDQIIYINLVITEGASETNPYGKFSMTFKSIPSIAPHDSPFTIFTGNLKTVENDDGKIEYVFYSSMGNDTTPFAMLEKAHVLTSPDGLTGQAYTYSMERFDMGPGGGEFDVRESEYDVAYNANNLRRSVDGGITNECFDRDDFNSMVWRYGLYDSSDGSRIKRNSGFSIRTADGEFGWIGYWGLWVPPEVMINSGDTVTRDTHDGGSGESYSVVKAPGKLIKHTKVEKTLGDLKTTPLNYWDDVSGKEFQVFWDSTNKVFEKKFVRSDTMTSSSWEAYGPETMAFSPNDWVGFWSDALGGSVSFIYPETGSPTDATPISFYKEEFMSSSALAGDVTLYCYYDCLKPNITQNQADWNGDTPFLPNSDETSSPHQYTFVKDSLTLQYGVQDVALASGVKPGPSSPNQWGFQSGAMIADTSVLVDGPWEIWNQDVFYTWETGHNQWNQYTGIKDDSDTLVSFDPPLHITYTHSTANDANGDSTYDGRIYQLDYSGFGELHGIPFNDDDGDFRWYPEFSIKDGTLMGDTNQYIVKAIEKEQSMRALSDTDCSVLDTSSGLAAPTDEYSDPAIGPKPTVTDPPAVIKGELK